MAPSRGDQGTIQNVNNANEQRSSSYEDNGGDNSPPSRLPSFNIQLSTWFSRALNTDYVEEDATDDYHIWRHQQNQRNTSNHGSHYSKYLSKDEHRAATIAACFLKDYEDGRPPTLSPLFDSIDNRQLQMYRFKHSRSWKLFGLSLATILLFVGNGSNRIWTLSMQMIAITLFGCDLYMKDQLHRDHNTNAGHPQPHSSSLRSTRTERWLMIAVATFLGIFTVQSWLVFLLLDNQTSSIHPSTLAVSIFKPIVFFYESRRARDALEALLRIGKKLLRVILIELFLILTFAAVACRLYSNDENFQTLSKSWLSLFALSTTVVNPGIWMPAYDESGWNAIFFVMFIVVGVFYLHSLVLSVVFQVFIKSATEVHRRSIADKEQSLRLSYLALTSSSPIDSTESTFLFPRVMRETLHQLRPHYNRLKSKVLMDVLIPAASEGSPERTFPLSYSHFRNKIRQVLTSSVRVTRSHSVLGLTVEVFGAFCAICNLVYVVLVTSKFDAAWFYNSEFLWGTMLTFAALIEAMLRYNPVKFGYRIDPMSRLNAILDGTGTIGALVSLLGIILKIAGDDNGMDFLLTGRAIGMIQSMRFSLWFREVLQRSLYVLPLLSGPIFLVLSTIHIFVCIGMLLWSGAVDPDELAMNENVEPLFYLNNFNSYGKGFVTIFNVLVVNDWHQIANVFLYAERNSDPLIVYTFFVTVVIVAVCIMLNVIVAFFVETFVTQLNLVDVEDEVLAGKRNPLSFDATELHKTDIISTNCSLTGETLQFDIIKREGYDEIMETVANQSSQSEAVAKSLRDAQEALTAMSSTSSTSGSIGHLFCCRQSMSQFGTETFRKLVGDYFRRDELHAALLEMLEHLSDTGSIVSPTSSECEPVVQQQHTHPVDDGQILVMTGTILPNNRSIAVLTAQVYSENNAVSEG